MSPGVFADDRQSLEIVLIARLHLGWRRWKAAAFRTEWEAGESRQRRELTNVATKLVIYEAFVDGKLEAPRPLAHVVPDLYLGTEVRSRTIWSLSNARSAILEPFRQLLLASENHALSWKRIARCKSFVVPSATTLQLAYIRLPLIRPISEGPWCT